MNTLAQALREALTELDTAKAIDSAYREMFSTFAKKPLRPGETWRLRLLQWCEREEALAPTPRTMTERQSLYAAAVQHWIKVGYNYERACHLAAAKHGIDDDVKAWALNLVVMYTNLRYEDLV